MVKIRAAKSVRDPATGRALSQGVDCRGPGQYRARKLADGKHISKTFETDRLAREWLADTSAKIREGSFVDRRALDQQTLGELVQKFVDERMQDGGPRRGAAEDRGHIPAILNDAIGTLPLSRLTTAEVRGFRDRQVTRFAAGTVVKRLNMLAGVIAHAIGEWNLPLALNPASGKLVKRPAGADVKRDRRLLVPTRAEIRAASASGEDPPLDEEARLLQAIHSASAVKHPPHDGTALFGRMPGPSFPDDVNVTRLAIAQAMRQGEILALRWADVDFETKIITVRGRADRGTKTGAHQKTAKSKAEIGWKRRPMTPEAIAVLKDQMKDQIERRLKANAEKKRGNPLCEPLSEPFPLPSDHVFTVGGSAAFRVRIGRIIKSAGLKNLTFHDLRHEATSRLAGRYPNPMNLKRVTGHIDLKSLDRYYQPDLTELAEQGGS